MAGLFDQLIMQLMQAQPMGLLGNMGSDQPQNMPGQQYGQQFVANLPSGIDMHAMRKLEELRRQLGVQANTSGGRDTDAALKAIEEALRYAPK